MPIVNKCRVKIEVTATRWEQQGDHPAIQQVPDNIHNVGGISDKNKLGMLPNAGQNNATVFCGPVWVIETGGNTFIADDQYYSDYYEIIPEEKVKANAIEPISE